MGLILAFGTCVSGCGGRLVGEGSAPRCGWGPAPSACIVVGYVLAKGGMPPCAFTPFGSWYQYSGISDVTGGGTQPSEPASSDAAAAR